VQSISIFITKEKSSKQKSII